MDTSPGDSESLSGSNPGAPAGGPLLLRLLAVLDETAMRVNNPGTSHLQLLVTMGDFEDWRVLDVRGDSDYRDLVGKDVSAAVRQLRRDGWMRVQDSWRKRRGRAPHLCITFESSSAVPSFEKQLSEVEQTLASIQARQRPLADAWYLVSSASSGLTKVRRARRRSSPR